MNYSLVHTLQAVENITGFWLFCITVTDDNTPPPNKKNSHIEPVHTS